MSSRIESVDHRGHGDAAAEAGRRCDFCGDRVAAVRRVALDYGYERLQTAHRELYSCASCFDAKEERRLGLKHR